jgi:cell fate (sporulation/competence/biofilm development) regulator YlbF (YheA/YmcA/DUF963 family)
VDAHLTDDITERLLQETIEGRQMFGLLETDLRFIRETIRLDGWAARKRMMYEFDLSEDRLEAILAAGEEG